MLCEGLIEPRPLGACATIRVRDELLAAGALQRIGLEVEALIVEARA